MSDEKDEGEIVRVDFSTGKIKSKCQDKDIFLPFSAGAVSLLEEMAERSSQISGEKQSPMAILRKAITLFRLIIECWENEGEVILKTPKETRVVSAKW